MLSRTADHLFWMARYMERAENTARMLDVNLQTSLLPQSANRAEAGWRGLLGISELEDNFKRKYGEVNAHNVMHFMVRDENNLSSILNCLRAARENARAVRGALTTEVWETQNQTWLGFLKQLNSGAFERDPASLFDWVKYRSHLSRGVRTGTMLEDEAMYFLRLGTFLERADNTARLLDAKLHALGGAFTQPHNGNGNGNGHHAQAQSQGGPHESQEVDFYYWSAVLRSVSAFEIYRRVYRNVIRPEKVAELLILRPDMPRSLLACLNGIMEQLQLVANDHSRETMRLAGKLQAQLRWGTIEEIMEEGLHDYLVEFLRNVGDLGVGISQDFLVPMAA